LVDFGSQLLEQLLEYDGVAKAAGVEEWEKRLVGWFTKAVVASRSSVGGQGVPLQLMQIQFAHSLPFTWSCLR